MRLLKDPFMKSKKKSIAQQKKIGWSDKEMIALTDTNMILKHLFSFEMSTKEAMFVPLDKACFPYSGSIIVLKLFWKV